MDLIEIAVEVIKALTIGDAGRARFAQVIGYGMTEDRDQVPPVHYPHNFNLGWLRAERGEGMLTHRHGGTQAFYRPATDEVRVPEPSRSG